MTTRPRTSAIRDELERLAEANGGELLPRTVVDAARDSESPLHASFEWDDSEAAEQYRMWQARQLIRAVVAYEPGKNGHMVPVPVFVSLTTDRTKGGAGYRLTTAVLSDNDHRRQLLLDARADMVRFKEKYRVLTELAAVFDAMDHAEAVTLPLEAAATA